MTQRNVIGIIAVALLILSLALILSGPASAAQEQFSAACLRIGVTMGALWFAYPRLKKLPGWLMTAVLALAVVIALRPKLFPLAAVLIVVLLIVRPRRNRQPSSRASKSTPSSRSHAARD